MIQIKAKPIDWFDGYSVHAIDTDTGFYIGRAQVREGNEIWNLLVSDEYKRQGIGTKLIKKCMELGGEVTWVYTHNVPSLELFTKLGFEVISHRNRIATLEIS